MVVAPPRELGTTHPFFCFSHLFNFIQLAGVYDNLFNIYCTKRVPEMFKGRVKMHPNTQCIYICDRTMVITKLRCRKAL